MIPTLLPTLTSYEEGYPWCDRRSGFDRRKPKSGAGASLLERRSGKDRRRPELPEIIEYRRARTQLREQLQAYQASCAFKRRLARVVVLVISALLGGSLLLFSLSKCDTLSAIGVIALFRVEGQAQRISQGPKLGYSSLQGANL